MSQTQPNNFHPRVEQPIRSSLPLPRNYHNLQSLTQEMNPAMNSFQHIPQPYLESNFILPNYAPHINNFVSIQNQQNFPSSQPMNSYPSQYTNYVPGSNTNYSQIYHQAPGINSQAFHPPRYSDVYHQRHGYNQSGINAQVPLKDSMDYEISKKRGNQVLRREYSKQSLNPGMIRNDSYIDTVSMNSVPQQFYTEDYGNDEFYSNLEEEYLQKVIIENKSKSNNQ